VTIKPVVTSYAVLEDRTPSVVDLDEQKHVVTNGEDVCLPWSRGARIMMYRETIVPKQLKHFQL
jgi:hypothetical protein